MWRLIPGGRRTVSPGLRFLVSLVLMLSACAAPARDFDRRASVEQAVGHLTTTPALLLADRRVCLEATAASSAADLYPTADPLLGLVKAAAMARDQRTYARCLEERGYTVHWPSPPPR